MIDPTLAQVFAVTKHLSDYVINGDYPGEHTVSLSMDGLDLIADLDGIQYRFHPNGNAVDAAGNVGGAR